MRSDYYKRGATGLSKQLGRGVQSIANKAHDMKLPTKCNAIRGRGKDNARFKGWEELTGTHLSSARCGAEQRGLEFSVSAEQLWVKYLGQGRLCALSGLPIVFSVSTPKRKGTASLDRIDSKKGYVIGNVQWVHKDVNQMKWHFDEGAFVHYCRLIARNSLPKAFVGPSLEEQSRDPRRFGNRIQHHP